jgi:hypothetical protein
MCVSCVCEWFEAYNASEDVLFMGCVISLFFSLRAILGGRGAHGANEGRARVSARRHFEFFFLS